MIDRSIVKVFDGDMVVLQGGASVFPFKGLKMPPSLVFMAWHARLAMANPDSWRLAEHLWCRLQWSAPSDGEVLSACFLIAAKVEEVAPGVSARDMAACARVSLPLLIRMELSVLHLLDWAVLRGWDDHMYSKGKPL